MHDTTVPGPVTRDNACFERIGSGTVSPVVVFGPAGIGPNWWRDVADGLPTSIHLIAPRLPGRESRTAEPPCDTADAAIADVMSWLESDLAEWSRGTIVGVCSGAIVAASLACEMQQSRRAGIDVIVVNPPSLAAGRTGQSTLSSTELRLQLANEGLLPQLVADKPDIFAFFEPTIRADLAIVESAPSDLPARVRSLVHAQRDFAVGACEWSRHDTALVRGLPDDLATLIAAPAALLVPVICQSPAGSAA